MNSRRTRCGQRLLDVEHRRRVREERHADGLDVRRQRRAAAGERVAAAGMSGSERPAGRERSSGEQAAAHRASDHLTTMLTRRPLATTTFTMVLPSVWACTCGSASAAASSDVLVDVGGHRHAAAHLAVHLHRHDDRLFGRDRGVARPASRRRPRRRAWPSRSHSSSAMCGANGDSISTSASTASRQHGRASPAARRSAGAAGSRRAAAWRERRSASANA